MNIPELLKIGWRKYKIEQESEKKNNEGDILLGEISYTNNTIYLNKEFGREQLELTLLHEVIHGIFHKQGHSEWCENEDLVDGMAEGLYELIIDNPSLFK